MREPHMITVIILQSRKWILTLGLHLLFYLWKESPLLLVIACWPGHNKKKKKNSKHFLDNKSDILYLVNYGNGIYLVQIISVFICVSFTQGYNHDFIFAEEKSVEQMIKMKLYGSKCDVHLILTSEKQTDWLSSLPAMFPSCSDILNFAVPHIRHGKNEQVSVCVHTLAQLQSQTW